MGDKSLRSVDFERAEPEYSLPFSFCCLRALSSAHICIEQGINWKKICAVLKGDHLLQWFFPVFLMGVSCPGVKQRSGVPQIFVNMSEMTEDNWQLCGTSVHRIAV